MANPFPGMDPYLEGDLWESVHANLANEITLVLAPLVRPKYVVLTTRRVVLTGPEDVEGFQFRWPDVGVTTGQLRVPGGATAVAEAPLKAHPLSYDAVPQFSAEVRDPRDRRLVTAIEILSHTNKRGSGLAEYQTKRIELCAGPANLVELDLLRSGTRYPVLPPPLPDDPYFAFISRADRRSELDVWPMPLRQPLPAIPIPLDPGDADAMLPLQPILDRLHAVVGYDASVDYGGPPPGPMSADDLSWIDERLRVAGKRP